MAEEKKEKEVKKNPKRELRDALIKKLNKPA